jgi:hypothetical protein
MSATTHHLTQTERTERDAAVAEDVAFVAVLVSGIALAVAILVLLIAL